MKLGKVFKVIFLETSDTKVYSTLFTSCRWLSPDIFFKHCLHLRFFSKTVGQCIACAGISPDLDHCFLALCRYESYPADVDNGVTHFNFRSKL